MKERPILFSAPMVRAILAGNKTVTRRVVKPQPYVANVADDGMRYWNVSGAVGGRIMLEPDFLARCPYGQPGDRLWVRENFWKDESGFKPTLLLGAKARVHMEYDADLKEHDRDELRSTQWRRKPCIHMPRWASRITLEVTAVRVDRLQAISRQEAAAEGVCMDLDGPLPPWLRRDRWPEENFAALWESINGAGSWAANPWVWIVEFRRITPPTVSE